MSEKKELLKELESKFKEEKDKLKFKASLDELDKVFFVRDFVLDVGFVSENFSRQLSRRIMDTFMGWAGYLHGLLMPNPSNMLNQTESKLFQSNEKRDKIWSLLREVMYFSSHNSIAGLSKDWKKEGDFIDGTLEFWNNRFKPGIIDILNEVNEGWGKKKGS